MRSEVMARRRHGFSLSGIIFLVYLGEYRRVPHLSGRSQNTDEREFESLGEYYFRICHYHAFMDKIKISFKSNLFYS